MSIARHHAEWLSLLDVSGPFLSMPVLLRIFPDGLDAHDADVARRLRMAYKEWQASQGSKAIATPTQRQWVQFVLREVLGFSPDAIAEGQRLPPALLSVLDMQGEPLQPDLAILERHSPVPKARVLVQLYPSARMMELLRAADVRLGLVTNGEQWMLVYAPPKETTTYVTWQASLWLDEPLTLRAFCSLLKAQRFFGMADDQSLEAMLRESANNQQEVTDQLGLQVRRAVEILVQAIDRADQDRGGTLLKHVSHHAVYESALTVMMRLVILFSAEERKLLLLGTPLYDQNYAVSTLGAQLREAADQHGEEVMEHRFDAWCRLLATFRAVHGGARHEQFQLPAYGSSLFDPDRFPFLEGRAGHDTPLQEAAPLPINNRVTLHLLDALQWLRVKLPGGGGVEPRRLSFRGLDIEQIGHVYEGLLDHDAQRATEPVLGLKGAGGREPEIALAQLEALRAKGEDALVEFLCEETGRSASAVKNALLPLPLGEGRGEGKGEGKWRAACNNDEALLARVLPFAGLVRDDDFDAPVVINAGSVFVTQTSTRRATGTHYTPRTLTEPIVKHTLEPLVYAGPAEGWPREQWRLRSPRELLQLKVCDMAMGSGAFLVQTCRYLSERLVDAWSALLPLPQGEGRGEGLGEREMQITPEGMPPAGRPHEQIVPADEDERLVFARRIVADRCLYGVDKNPMAVEMAKLSLWLVTMGKDRPFTFLDHALKCGDSLVGADVDHFERWAHSLAGTSQSSVMSLFDETLRKQLMMARDKRRELASFGVGVIADAERKVMLLKEADKQMSSVRLGCDLLIGSRLLGLKPKQQQTLQNESLIEFMKASDESQLSETSQQARQVSRAVRAFHWPFEFPEVFEEGGFNAVVGNPPFLGGTRISTMMGTEYLTYLRGSYPTARHTADLCAFFFLNAFAKLKSQGCFGLVATNTIAQGDTREAALDVIAKSASIFRAISSMEWPNVAAVHVSIVHVIKGPFAGRRWLNDQSVDVIDSFLDSQRPTRKPYRLLANSALSFEGSKTTGMGFVLEPYEAQRLIDKDPRNRDVLFPYLNGEDLNSRPDQSPSRWVINFHDWPLDRSAKGRWMQAGDDKRKDWLREGRVPSDYPDPVVIDYPDSFEIVERLVKPERTRLKSDGTFALRKPLPQRWWHYGEKRPALYATIADLDFVLVTVLHSKYLSFCILPKSFVFSHACAVITDDSYARFAALQSTLHEVWVRTYASSLETRLRYTTVDVFETYPFPEFENLPKNICQDYVEHRKQTMLSRNEGLTKTYNRFHDAGETSADIAHLRALHVEMDNAVAAAYGWADLDLGHGFHDTAQGMRYTLAAPVRRTVLARLLELNHQRWAEEQAEAQRAEAEANPLGKRRKRKGSTQDTLPLVVREAGAQYDLFNETLEDQI